MGQAGALLAKEPMQLTKALLYQAQGVRSYQRGFVPGQVPRVLLRVLVTRLLPADRAWYRPLVRQFTFIEDQQRAARTSIAAVNMLRLRDHFVERGDAEAVEILTEGLDRSRDAALEVVGLPARLLSARQISAMQQRLATQVARYEVGALRRLRALRLLLPTNMEVPSALLDLTTGDAADDVPLAMSYETIVALARDRQALLSAANRCVLDLRRTGLLRRTYRAVRKFRLVTQRQLRSFSRAQLKEVLPYLPDRLPRSGLIRIPSGLRRAAVPIDVGSIDLVASAAFVKHLHEQQQRVAALFVQEVRLLEEAILRADGAALLAADVGDPTQYAREVYHLRVMPEALRPFNEFEERIIDTDVDFLTSLSDRDAVAATVLERAQMSTAGALAL